MHKTIKIEPPDEQLRQHFSGAIDCLNGLGLHSATLLALREKDVITLELTAKDSQIPDRGHTRKIRFGSSFTLLNSPETQSSFVEHSRQRWIDCYGEAIDD
jgi:hypothetical protein